MGRVALTSQGFGTSFLGRENQMRLFSATLFCAFCLLAAKFLLGFRGFVRGAHFSLGSLFLSVSACWFFSKGTNVRIGHVVQVVSSVVASMLHSVSFATLCACHIFGFRCTAIVALVSQCALSSCVARRAMSSNGKPGFMTKEPATHGGKPGTACV